jgi:hypothetical protein
MAIVTEMLPALDNLVSFGTDVFKARADYRGMILDIYTMSMTSDQLGENDRVNGSKLAESLLLNLRGQADDVRHQIPPRAEPYQRKYRSNCNLSSSLLWIILERQIPRHSA